MTVPVRPAQDAHDAFGMNTHFGFQHPQDTNHFTEQTVDLLLELGVGRVRQKLYCDPGRSRRATRAGLQRLMAAGVKVCAPTLVIDDATSLDAARARMEEYLDEIELNPAVYDLRLIEAMPGLNEPNGGKRMTPEWPRQTRWAQQAIFERTRARPAFNHIPIQGPPLMRPGGRPRAGAGPGISPGPEGLRPGHRRLGPRGRQEHPAAPGGRQGRPDGPAASFAAVLAAHAAEVGDLSPWADRADVHIYPGDQDSLNGGPPQLFLDAIGDMYRAGRPVTVTEAGWANCSPDDPDGHLYAGGAKSCPESVTAKYAPKLPLNALFQGHDAVYAYEMLENQPPYADNGPAMRQARFGYIRTPGLDPSTWERKAQFHAMRRYLALFSDPGPAFDPVGLPVAVTGDCPDLRSMLFQRRTGQHVLALWRPVDLYVSDRRTNAGTYLDVAPVRVSVTLDGPRPVAVHRPSRQDGPVGGGTEPSFTVDVGDELVVLVID